MPHRGQLLAPLLIAALLTVAGCSTAGAGGTAVLEGTGESANLDFRATTLDGETFHGESLAGKPAVLWFWAPWCPTCRAQIPNLEEQAAEYGDDVAFVGVGGIDTEESIRTTAGGIDNLTHLVDPQGLVWRHFGVTAQSTYTVIRGDGEIVSEGYLDDGALNALVKELASE